MNEAGYYQHRDFSQDHIRRVRSFYLPFFHDAERILELGCGRGELLEVLREAGKSVHGVELDAEMAKEAVSKGIDVSITDARSYLASTEASYDAIVAAHLLEHLEVAEADEVVGLAAARLPRGGILCLIVPNPASWPVLSEEFWNDPTHVRPYGRELLGYLGAKHGLRTLHSGTNPIDLGGYPIDLGSLEVGAAGSPIRRIPRPQLGHLRHLSSFFEGSLKAAQTAPDATPATRELWKGLGYLVSGLTEELRDAHQRVEELGEQVLYLNHQLAVMGGNFRRLVEILYAPNEFYVVCQRS